MIYAILLTVSVGLILPDRQAYEWIGEAATTSARRSMQEFAESEIWLPKSGPYGGQKFSCEFQPFTRLFFTEVDSGRWPRTAATGPTQSGKTCLCHVIPVCFHVFELRETAVIGIPDMRVANDKWQIDYVPIIDASPALRALKPTKGEGSAGGQVKSCVVFQHGAMMRFMTASQRDTGRASFTSRVLAATEVDNYPKRGEGSEETDKVGQLEGRLRATKMLDRRIYLECTVTVEEGRIWQEVKNGTDSRIVCQCPFCKARMTPERENLKGWQGATSEWEAHDKARWHCLECDKPWSEAAREDMNHTAVLVHRGQEVTPRGKVVGDPPPVFTFGFRWNAFNNLFSPAGDIGVDEWQGARAVDRDPAERKLCQQVHCLPYEDPDVDIERLDFKAITERATRKKGIVPKGTVAISVGVDTSKRKLDWVASAWRPDGSGQVVEYGEHLVEWQRLGVTGGLVTALRDLAAYLRWEVEGGGEMRPVQVWIDSGYAEHREGVYSFCREINQQLGVAPGRERFRPARGYGVRQRMMTAYRPAKKRSSEIRYIGRDYHMAKITGAGVLLVHVNADTWKGEFHRALGKAEDEPGGLVLYEGPPMEHRDFFDQVTAEERREEYEEGKGTIVYWHTLRRKNHKLDAGYLAQAAGHFALTMLTEDRGRQKPQKWWSNRKGKR